MVNNNVYSDELYRLQISTGQIKNLSETIPERPIVVAQAEDHSWSVIRTYYEIYLTGPQDSTPHAILGDYLNRAKIMGGWSIYEVRWIPPQHIIVVGLNGGMNFDLSAFEMPSGEPLWHYAGMQLETITSDGWLVMSFVNHALVRVRPDGFGLGQIVSDSSFKSFFGITPDGQWIVYRVYNKDANTCELWRVSLMGGTTNRIFHTNSIELCAIFMDWSPDQQWILIALNYGIRAEQQWLNLHSGEVRPLVEWGDARFLDWFGTIDRAWQPLGLMGLGAALIGINRVLARTKKSA